ncbi:putative Zn-binding protein involved in type VI secretion [Paraburkholderia sp. UCT70]|uniref:Zn-binding Pro-Ala-Ala-Arg (PAAR) domain-containing protein, incolved in TypeVI secretion n=1 Tax=Paraburkholderia tuberum TaxID=157910 RepID=A0A1H1FFS0_9BURK|nr:MULTISPECIES: PAAR domain-containing protein [Paraburkholderia]MBB5408071.1 putative Zn-binding protein involved in type VI secretion [Paraburkholderia sp. HC6.4b]MBB5453062.1 putative Zn-binding protein involved in type VI secretion [Paraburkholderia sp. Kb1A]MBC8725236.1 PAAR domain-containing protein [Paraburkholderia sp. 31.1]MBC8728050.1 PAAR domain-containing protein [Paraburkholderia sp. UCT2]SDQ99785.1 Zn-binding Pro-Ala-Ala-Arg (PAAR) domain-containing protein, incolved in TypeVI s
MKNGNGQPMIRLADKTTHDGTVIEAATDLMHMGIPVALDGHGVECPRCGGVYPIIATGQRTHNGKRVSHAGDRTGCGAILIAS